MFKPLLYSLAGLFATAVFAQTPGAAMGGEYVFNSQHINCTTPLQHAQIEQLLNQKKDSLGRAKKLIAKSTNQNPLFIWPVQQADGFNYNSTWSISNYVDHNAAYPNQVTDFNCGMRTYDTADGYNHAGIDIFTWPFSWSQMQNNQTKVVAAAPGQIIYKSDGNFDQNCTFNSDNWNAVYILHTDGSIAWYGHMKKNSLTAKQVGATVEQGEFLGFIGSSGNSTGPHLHFEVYNADLDLIDPYAGSCNDLNTASWWQDQKPYANPNINALLTHTAPPDFNTCPETESVNDATTFSAGQTVYSAIYFRDQQPGTTVTLRVRRPNNTLKYNWTANLNDSYYSSYWYWAIQTDMDGIWTWEATYQGQTVTHSFTVGTLGTAANSLSATTLFPNPAGDVVSITGNTTVVGASVYDGLGKLLSEEKNPDGLTQLDTSALADGIYQVTLSDASGVTKTVKLVRKK
jgi:murein DD-endopeptidase MepM/ murein hydrolase activator NlpD